MFVFIYRQKTAYEMRISDWKFRRVHFRSPTGWFKAQPAGRSALMMGGESGRDPNEEDSRLESLKERLRQAGQDEAVRTGSTQKVVDQGYRLGNRVLAELVGGIAGGALIVWFFDWLFSTSP